MRIQRRGRSRAEAGLAVALMAAGLGWHSLPAHAKRWPVLLDWFVNPDHAPLYVAREKGYFTKSG